MKLGDVVRSGDWKNEKHVPVIDAPDRVQAGQAVQIEVGIGADNPHPNTAEHHIRWIKLLFQPTEGFTFELADIQLAGHGEGLKGGTEGPVYTDPFARVTVRLKESGTIIALSYCNIHGLWENSKTITVE
ncbi:MAG: class II SORL domain-containing protein [Limnochordia bacterium]|jgi:superoxide reductase|nr:class II SORL domain-containing protein [Limnochordia bacterium]